ncbi:hypothetical protein, partial [Segatella baroniae]|uniref:hypothetical protein n=1 Tax=Segatella baroniae TaxID=305719 RepID=UPI001EE36E3C
GRCSFLSESVCKVISFAHYFQIFLQLFFNFHAFIAPLLTYIKHFAYFLRFKRPTKCLQLQPFEAMKAVLLPAQRAAFIASKGCFCEPAATR